MRIVKVLFEVSATGHIVNSLRINESYRHDVFAKRRVWNNHFYPVRQREVRVQAVVDVSEYLLQPRKRQAAVSLPRDCTKDRAGRADVVASKRELRPRALLSPQRAEPARVPYLPLVGAFRQPSAERRGPQDRSCSESLG